MDPEGLCAIADTYGLGKDILEDILAYFDGLAPDSVLGRLLATGGKTLAVLAYGIYNTPVELVNQCMDFMGNPSLSTIPILGPLGQYIGESTAQAVISPNADTISQAVGAWCAGTTTALGGAAITRAAGTTKTGQFTRKVLADKKLWGKEYPTKLNRGGKVQPYNPETGRFLSYDSNPGFKLSPINRFSSGSVQGWAEAKGAVGATPVGRAGNIGYMLGRIIGGLF